MKDQTGEFSKPRTCNQDTSALLKQRRAKPEKSLRRMSAAQARLNQRFYELAVESEAAPRPPSSFNQNTFSFNQNTFASQIQPTAEPRLPNGNSLQPTDLAIVQRLIVGRRHRKKHFAPHLLSDPAWDILLNLYDAELKQQRVSTMTLTSLLEAPATTALRWISKMSQAGVLAQRKDPLDARRVFIELAEATSQSMRGYIAAATDCMCTPCAS